MPLETFDLSGKAAIVTGASSGLGRHAARCLAAAGAKVAIAARRLEPLVELEKQIEALDGRAIPLRLDVADPASVTDCVKAAETELGPISILVNNAGITGPNQKTWEYSLEDWERVLAVDLTAVFLCCRALLPDMLTQGYGRVVNIASVAGKEGNPNAAAYSTAKAAVIGLTKSLGKETAGSGVIVNCVTPAAVETDIFKQMTQEHIDYMLSKIPMGRFGKVEEVAALVAWLASDDCSFSTGAVFDISGGRATY